MGPGYPFDMRQTRHSSSFGRFAFPGMLLAWSLGSAGCTTQGYSGPELPKEQVSNISFHPTGTTNLERILVDGKALGFVATSVDVLPGDHPFQVSYQLELNDCSGLPHDGRTDCLVTTLRGVCDGNVVTRAGRPYLVTIDIDAYSSEARVAAKSYWEFSERSDEPTVGSGSCREISRYDSYRRQ